MKELAPQDRPREKLTRVGPAALGDNEIVALLVSSGTRARSALVLAGDILDLAGGVAGLAGLTPDDLRRVPGVGASRAARLLAAVELGRRVLGRPPPRRARLQTASDTAHFLLPLYSGHRVERFGLVLLDTKRRLIRTTILSTGSLDTSIAQPREVFREAMLASASAVVLFHNHPSGDPQPSSDDLWLTQRLVHAGQVVGIDIVDHIILGDGRWYSFREARRL